MSGKVAMTYQTVTAVAQGFDQQAQILGAISKGLEAAIEILRAMAFASMGTSLALANYLQTIKDKIDKLVKLCNFYTQNLNKAVNDHKTGQYDAGSYFPDQGI